jgi:IclR family acetate operon transcriptional repressor
MKRPRRPREEDPTKSLERYVIPNLRNACDIMKLLGANPEGLKAAEIARTLSLPVTTTLRIMATLQLEGYVRKVEGRFELGPVLIHLGNASLAGTEIREAALPVLQQLTAATEETSHLAIPCDARALIVAVQDSPHPLRAASRPGYLAELHCSSTGKIFLAYLHGETLATALGKSPVRRTPHTLTTLAEIKREVALTRSRGYSLDNEEYHPGVRCCAAPVFGSDGNVVAAIGITAARVRFPDDRIGPLTNIVRQAAADLGRSLGYNARPTTA